MIVLMPAHWLPILFQTFLHHGTGAFFFFPTLCSLPSSKFSTVLRSHKIKCAPSSGNYSSLWSWGCWLVYPSIYHPSADTVHLVILNWKWFFAPPSPNIPSHILSSQMMLYVLKSVSARIVFSEQPFLFPCSGLHTLYNYSFTCIYTLLF